MIEHTRRRLLRDGVALTAVGLVGLPLRAAPVALADSLARVFGRAPINEGNVLLTLPPLAENGNSVAMQVEVDSPMTDASHVRSIHVFSEKNPLPDVARFHLGPRAGRARVATRIRLADTQTVVAVATMNDGSLWSGSARTIVTLAACIDLT